MTARQLETIAALRQCNYPYSFIGRELGLSINTVKSICRRKGMMAEGKRKTKIEKESISLCKYCHKPLTVGMRQDAVFCSGNCRTKWRREHFTVTEKQP